MRMLRVTAKEQPLLYKLLLYSGRTTTVNSDMVSGKSIFIAVLLSCILPKVAQGTGDPPLGGMGVPGDNYQNSVANSRGSMEDALRQVVQDDSMNNAAGEDEIQKELVSTQEPNRPGSGLGQVKSSDPTVDDSILKNKDTGNREIMKEQMWEKAQQPAAAVMAAKKLFTKTSGQGAGRAKRASNAPPPVRVVHALRASALKVSRGTVPLPPSVQAPQPVKDEDEIELVKIEGQLKKAEDMK